jgi:hypothetical protein
MPTGGCVAASVAMAWWSCACLSASQRLNSGVVAETLEQLGVVAKKRLHCAVELDTAENLVYVHRVQQRLVVSGLKFVGTDE